MMKQLIRKLSGTGCQEEAEASSEAARAFIRKNYECYDVLGYMAKKYDIKGAVSIGEEDIGADRKFP